LISIFSDKRAAEHESDLRRLSIIVIVGALINAFVCGALSGRENRYQARVWLIPLVAGLIYQRRSIAFKRGQLQFGSAARRLD
jgi:hypothetical protein